MHKKIIMNLIIYKIRRRNVHESLEKISKSLDLLSSRNLVIKNLSCLTSNIILYSSISF